MNQALLRKTIFLPLLVVVSSQAWGAEPAAGPKKVLMIGNSLTYTYNIPGILRQFAAETDRELTLVGHFAGGKDLTWHWENSRKPNGATAAKAIDQGDFDLVILQDSSKRSMSKEMRADFRRITTEYHQLAQRQSTRMMFYMGFLRNGKFPPKEIEALGAMYTDQADKLQIPCAPVALAFQRCHQERPDLALLDNQTDAKYALNRTGTHQSPFGSYLAACTLYAAIYQQSPVGLKFRAAYNGKQEVTFSEADAAAAQDIAWRTWQAYQAKRKLDE